MCAKCSGPAQYAGGYQWLCRLLRNIRRRAIVWPPPVIIGSSRYSSLYLHVAFFLQYIAAAVASSPVQVPPGRMPRQKRIVVFAAPEHRHIMRRENSEN